MPVDEGAPAAETTPSHGAELPRGLEAVPRSVFLEGRFGRLFRLLPPFEPPDDLLIDLGRSGGPMMEGTGGGQDNATIPSGFTYLGQFIDHDITFDPTSSFARKNDPDGLENFRTPRFDLDSLYASGPKASPWLFDTRAPTKFLIGKNPAGEFDLPRNTQQVALVGDPRNDENIIVSQLHALPPVPQRDRHASRAKKANQEAHAPASRSSTTAQRLVRWHYQWVVLHDFLPRIVGKPIVDARVTKDSQGKFTITLDHYEPTGAGVHPGRVRGRRLPVRPLDDPAALRPERRDRREHLRQARRRPALAPRRWPAVAGFLASEVGALLQVPQQGRAAAEPQDQREADAAALPAAGHRGPSQRPELHSLAVRNLLRGKALGLPSGQAVATAVGATPITNTQLGLSGAAWDSQAPLWFYILKEAQRAPQSGQRLGPVGGLIVAEVLLGLLKYDATSFVNAETPWKPLKPIAPTAGNFGIANLLKFAGVA